MKSKFISRARAAAAVLLIMLFTAHPAAAAAGLTPMSGAPAPALVLNDLHGAVHDLAQYRGKVVLINFWATWCEPCRHEMPSMQRLRDKLAGKPFAVFAVNVAEPDARVRRFLEDTRLDLPVLLDANKTVTRAWSVRVMPTTFIVDQQGRLRYRVVGDIDWSADTVVRALAQLVGGG
jgi:thiol-disulfide isomerase/thioredoxin